MSGFMHKGVEQFSLIQHSAPAYGVAVQNTTGHVVFISAIVMGAHTIQHIDLSEDAVNWTTVARHQGTNSNDEGGTMCAFVPAGHFYRIIYNTLVDLITYV